MIMHMPMPARRRAAKFMGCHEMSQFTSSRSMLLRCRCSLYQPQNRTSFRSLSIGASTVRVPALLLLSPVLPRLLAEHDGPLPMLCATDCQRARCRAPKS